MAESISSFKVSKVVVPRLEMFPSLLWANLDQPQLQALATKITKLVMKEPPTSSSTHTAASTTITGNSTRLSGSPLISQRPISMKSNKSSSRRDSKMAACKEPLMVSKSNTSTEKSGFSTITVKS